jgi:hypothetical protein
MKHKNRNPKFNEGAKFPIAEGSTWDIFLQDGKQSIRKAQHQVDKALRTAEQAFQAEANTCTRSKDMMLQIAAHRDHPSGQKSWKVIACEGCPRAANAGTQLPCFLPTSRWQLLDCAGTAKTKEMVWQ